MKKETKSEFYVVLAAILWGFIGVNVTALSAEGASRSDISFLRAFVAFVSLAVFLLFTDKKAFRIRLKDIWCFLGTGIAGLLMFNICYFTCMKMTSIAVAAVLLYTAPAFVIVLSAVLFKEKITYVKIISLCSIFFGCMLVSGVFEENGSYTPAGVLIGICSGFGYALYSIFGRYAINRGYSSATISLYTFAFAAVGGVFVADFNNIFQTFNSVTVVHSLSIGIVCCLLPYIFYTKGMENMDTGKASVLSMAEPLVAAFVSVFIDGAPGLVKICGMAVMFGGIIFVSLKGNDK